MDAFKAVSIAEGFDEPATHEEYIEAWQFLVDSGLAWRLQGFFGRTATAMIESGELQYKPSRKHSSRDIQDMEEARW